jgi:hypothetical protein
MVLTAKDHCASKVVLAYLLAFRKDARLVKVRVLIAFLNHRPFYISFLLICLHQQLPCPWISFFKIAKYLSKMMTCD